jgi:hypothetical protein
VKTLPYGNIGLVVVAATLTKASALARAPQGVREPSHRLEV